MEKVKGFKGFNKDLKCNGYQYKIGETHKHEGEMKICNSGFHFCEYPLDVFNYYSPAESKFAEVEADEVSEEKSDDSKRVCKTLRITAEISLKAMIDAAIKFTFDRADFSGKENHAEKDQGAASATGYRGAASATGDRGAASATGDRGAASATGYQGAASATGEEGCAVALGIEGRVKGKKGAWLTVAEWEIKKGEWHRVDVQTVRVDGKKIKEDIFYQLKKGEFVEA